MSQLWCADSITTAQLRVTPKIDIGEQHNHQRQAIKQTKPAPDGAAHTRAPAQSKQQNHTTHARQQHNKNKAQHTAHRPPRREAVRPSFAGS
jgi:hypothetical protein